MEENKNRFIRTWHINEKRELVLYDKVFGEGMPYEILQNVVSMESAESCVEKTEKSFVLLFDLVKSELDAILANIHNYIDSTEDLTNKDYCKKKVFKCLNNLVNNRDLDFHLEHTWIIRKEL